MGRRVETRVLQKIHADISAMLFFHMNSKHMWLKYTYKVPVWFSSYSLEQIKETTMHCSILVMLKISSYWFMSLSFVSSTRMSCHAVLFIIYLFVHLWQVSSYPPFTCCILVWKFLIGNFHLPFNVLGWVGWDKCCLGSSLSSPSYNGSVLSAKVSVSFY